MSKQAESEVWTVRFQAWAKRISTTGDVTGPWVGNRYLGLPGTETPEAVQKAVTDALDGCVREVTVQIGTAVPCKPDWSPEAAHAKPATGGGTSEA